MILVIAIIAAIIILLAFEACLIIPDKLFRKRKKK